MTINHLRYFYAVCKTGCTTGAARELLVSQPAVSNAIKILEQELGIHLFKRQNKHLYLTPEGEIMYERTAEVLQAVERLTQTAQSLTQNSSIYICAPPVTSLICYSPLFQRFQNFFPNIHLDIHEHGSLKSIELVAQKKAELAVIVLTDSIDSSFEVLPLTRTSIAYTVSTEHHMSHLEKVTIEQVRHEQFVIMNPQFYQTGVLVQEWFQNAEVHPDHCSLLNQIYLINKLIKEGASGAFLLKDYAKRESNLVGIPLEPAIPVDIALVWEKNAAIRDNVLKFISFARESHRFFDNVQPFPPQ